ncbi:hypothetical protein FA15DRAFT_669200 [Coprinopsis marcescibilis]|uniref:Uncharacterized protein n=1 Tax=Coprinopsis marcescibilis TaxID=230819 RepID=A0A5C3KWX2_COPMA|nr:hypothetical protein FA15DRAFT_669200 [Coprinopsis marcescibilis]
MSPYPPHRLLDDLDSTNWLHGLRSSFDSLPPARAGDMSPTLPWLQPNHRNSRHTVVSKEGNFVSFVSVPRGHDIAYGVRERTRVQGANNRPQHG